MIDREVTCGETKEWLKTGERPKAGKAEKGKKGAETGEELNSAIGTDMMLLEATNGDKL